MYSCTSYVTREAKHIYFQKICRNKIYFEISTCICLHSWPLAGKDILLNVIGHFRETFMAVCSTPSSPFNALLADAATLLKFLFIFSMQWVAYRSRFLNKPWRTDRTAGRWTSWSKNKWDWNIKESFVKHLLKEYKIIEF